MRSKIKHNLATVPKLHDTRKYQKISKMKIAPLKSRCLGEW